MFRSLLPTSSRLILRLPQQNFFPLKNFSSFRVSASISPINLKSTAPAFVRSVHKAPFLHSSGSGGSSSGSSCPAQTDWKKMTNEDWAERLSPEAYFCTREGGTEPPFSGQYVNHKAEGVYKCVGCGSDLFTSKAKYDSGSGWPSFFTPADENAIIRRKDVSHGMVRTEILCANCNAHLGHVFDDGPQPTGKRFCINSVSLKFTPKKLS